MPQRSTASDASPTPRHQPATPPNGPRADPPVPPHGEGNHFGGPQASAADLRIAVDMSPAPCCWLGRNGAILHCNSLATDLLGAVPPPGTLIQSFGVPWERIGSDGSGTAEVAEMPATLRDAAGVKRQVQLSVRAIENGDFLCALTELPSTESCSAGGALNAEDERDRLRTVLENVASGVVVMDFNGVVRGAYSVRCGGQETPLTPGVNIRQVRDQFHVELPSGEPLPFEQWPYMKMMRGEEVNDVLLYVQPRGKPHGGWFRYNGRKVHDEHGGEDLFVMTVRDESDQQNALAALRESEGRFRQIFDNTAVGLTMIDSATGQFLAANGRVAEMLGYSPKELLGKTFADVTHPDDREADAARFKAAIADGKLQYGMEKRYQRKDGSTMCALLEVVVRREDEDLPRRSYGIILDITARKQAEERLRESEERFRAIFENAAVGVTVVEAISRRFMEVNRCFADMLGYTRDEMLRLTVDDITHPEDIEKYPRGLAAAVEQGGREFVAEKRHLCKDGSVKWVSVDVAVQRDYRGRPTHSIGIVRDITATKTADRKLRESETRFRRLADSIPEIVWVSEADGRLRYRNRRSEELFQTFLQDSQDPRVAKIIHPLDVARRNKAWARSLRTGEDYECELRVADPDGANFRWMLSRAVAARDDSGQIEGWYGTATDIHDLKVAEQALQQERERFMTIAQASPGVLNTLHIDPGGRLSFPYASAGIVDLTGIPSSALEADASHLLDAVHPDDLAGLLQTVQQAAAGRDGWCHQFRIRCPDRGEVWLEGRYAHGAVMNGAVTQHGVLTDVTDSRRLADHIRDTQKMEAIGRLAGGVAHDFNNLLAVILGEAELQLETERLDDSTREALSVIAEAAGKGATLTRQLLTFSRRRAETSLSLDLSEQIQALWKLAARLVGKGVQCDNALSESALPVRAAPGQLEQALFNLLINARDAMSGEGTITIGTRLVDQECVAGRSETGPWAELFVRDHGPGIPEEVRQRMFEPFFTTKEVGKGTGLGLAVVHGIAEQCGGAILAESPPEGGATFRLLLPLCPPDADPADGRTGG
ncbi:Blue-light-activated protein [Posidoniimonas corsicana]|uniref:histidine kinase n=1 Tax=Posidoniimonas corsicana TaxID=1938618 RepID=A0A5C5UV32_9BACT|nr:PAS domain S-box protein [Posidoniimonas corsicana]TWT30226.1 Blue-light-activated protein [Posidoniimonas corsicana]